jgi:hypothetical protein
MTAEAAEDNRAETRPYSRCRTEVDRLHAATVGGHDGNELIQLPAGR